MVETQVRKLDENSSYAYWRHPRFIHGRAMHQKTRVSFGVSIWHFGVKMTDFWQNVVELERETLSWRITGPTLSKRTTLEECPDSVSTLSVFPSDGESIYGLFTMITSLYNSNFLRNFRWHIYDQSGGAANTKLNNTVSPVDYAVGKFSRQFWPQLSPPSIYNAESVQEVSLTSTRLSSGETNTELGFCWPCTPPQVPREELITLHPPTPPET